MTDSAIKYGLSLCGVPYRWWLGGPISEGGPFYAGNYCPTHEQLSREGLNCAGLINLMRKHAGLELPEEPGTGGWWKYLSERGKLQTFDPDTTYPAGTLLLRPYESLYDQGHLAVILDNNVPAMRSRLLHCYHPMGVYVDENVQKSHEWFADGYYRYVALPDSWLIPS